MSSHSQGKLSPFVKEGSDPPEASTDISSLDYLFEFILKFLSKKSIDVCVC